MYLDVTSRSKWVGEPDYEIGEEQITTVPARKFIQNINIQKPPCGPFQTQLGGQPSVASSSSSQPSSTCTTMFEGGKNKSTLILQLQKRARTKKLSPCFPVCPPPTHPHSPSPLPETALGAAKGTRIMLLLETFFCLSLLSSLGNSVELLKLQ